MGYSYRPLDQTEFTLVSSPAELDAIHRSLDDLLRRTDRPALAASESEWADKLKTAVLEIASNIIVHAFPRGVPPGKITVRMTLYSDRVNVVFLDGGAPFEGDLTKEYSVSELLEELPEGGYGLLIARRTLDQLSYCRTASGENQWTLVKLFEH